MNKNLVEEVEIRTSCVAAAELNNPSGELNAGSKQSANDVAKQLHEDIGRRRKRSVHFMILLCSFTLLTVFNFTANVSGWLGWAITLTFTLLAASVIACGLPSRRRTRHLQLLADQAGVAEVGTLLEMCTEIQSVQTRRALKAGLIRNLPKVQESDAIRLSSRNRAQLHEALEQDHFGPYPKERADYVIAVLKAMEKIGDERSLKYVRRLGSMSSRVTGERGRVREAARGSLRVLETRLARSKSPSVLLRPSSTGECEILLRSVDTSASVSQSLLRSGDES